jgi:tetratricopeptide (TPR) repeat protein
LRLSPESDNIRFYLASVLEQGGKLSESQKELARIPLKSKLYPEALRSRLSALNKSKQTNEARKLLNEAFKDARKEGLAMEDFYEVSISFLDSSGQLKEARSELDEATKEFPQSERLHYLGGNLLEKEGRSDEAVKTMQKLLKKNPKHVGALNFIGYLWAERGTNLDQAENYVRQALKLKPNDPFITDSLGWILFKRGRLRDSLQTLEQAFALRPDESVIADHLGDCLVKLGRIQDARKYYEIALKLGPEKDADRKKLESKLDHVGGPGTCRTDATTCARSLLDARAPAASP